jgi:hypothetical protein
MLVRADDAGLLDPEDVAEGVVARVEEQVPDRGLVAERHPRTFFHRRPDESSGDAVTLDHVLVGLRHVDDLVGRRRRRLDSGNVNGRHVALAAF